MLTLYRHIKSGELYTKGITSHQAMLIVNKQWKNSIVYCNDDLFVKSTFEVIAK